MPVSPGIPQEKTAGGPALALHLPMKVLFSCLLLFAFSLAARAAPALRETVEGGNHRFQVTVEPDLHRVEVVPEKEDALTSPPHITFRILRKNKTPLDVQLRTISVPRRPFHYEGQIDQWDSSYIGFELVFPFGKGQKALRSSSAGGSSAK
jgi:hypothetical protein